MFNRKFHLLPLLLFLLISGCTEKKEEFVVSSTYQDWTVERKFIKNGNNDWYIDTQVFYVGNETIARYSMNYIVPEPLKVKGRLFGSTNNNELKRNGILWSNTKIMGSKDLEQSQLEGRLREVYLNINYRKDDLSKWENIIINDK